MSIKPTQGQKDVLGLMIEMLQGDPEDPLSGLIHQLQQNRDALNSPDEGGPEPKAEAQPRDEIGALIEGMEAGKPTGIDLRSAAPQPRPRPATLPGPRRHEVSPWFDSMFGIESSYDPNAVSPKGAVGIAQMLPETAAETAKILGEPFKPEFLTDPAWSKRMGIATFNRFAEQFGRDPWLTLAAYNAGPRRVKEAGGTSGNVTEILPRLPLETRNHLARMAERLGVKIGDHVVP